MNIIKLSELRKICKGMGYKVTSKNISFVDLARDTFLDVKIYDGKVLINRDFITLEHVEKYKNILDLINNNKIVKGA